VAVVFVLLALALVVGLSAGLGIGWIAVFPLLLLLALAVWSGLVFKSGRAPGQVIRRRPRRTQLLGPGGPDDPDANR
jgi:hypothetical protein